MEKDWRCDSNSGSATLDKVPSCCGLGLEKTDFLCYELFVSTNTTGNPSLVNVQKQARRIIQIGCSAGDVLVSTKAGNGIEADS
jgi:hypothetical protein